MNDLAGAFDRAPPQGQAPVRRRSGTPGQRPPQRRPAPARTLAPMDLPPPAEGVCDGEDGKWRDFSQTVPVHLIEDVVVPAARDGKRAVILFEDWQTANAAISTRVLAERAGLRHALTPFWNANTTCGFGAIDFPRLACGTATLSSCNRTTRASSWHISPRWVPGSSSRSASGPTDRQPPGASRGRGSSTRWKWPGSQPRRGPDALAGPLLGP